MKNRIFTLFLFVFITGIFFCALNYSFDGGIFDIKSLTTDSGFDSDFGGSDFGGGSDFSDYGSSGGNSELTIFDAFVIEIFFTMVASVVFLNYSKVKFHICFWGRIVFLSFLNFVSPYVAILDFLLIVILATINSNKIDSKSNIGNLFSVNDVSEDLLIKIGVKDSLKSLKKKVYDSYVNIQKAWSDNDIDKARDLLSDEIYNMYFMQIMTMINKNQRNVMSDFNLINCFINNVTLKDDLFTVEVSLNVTCKDYMIDSTNNEVIRGDDNRINDYYYKLIFVMAKEVDINSCPNCHGKINKKGNSVKCEYCGSVINRKSTNLVLVDKKIVKQGIC